MINKTALLDLQSFVTILAIDEDNKFVLVMDEDGDEMEVSINRLDNIQDEILDLSPLEAK